MPRTMLAMTPPQYFQLDVFTDRAGGGNPLGVVYGAEHWREADMQGFATWTGLVETTYLLPPSHPDADYRLRIFTPSREIPFAGHPSIGSAHAALESGLVAADRTTLIQECDAGLLPVSVSHIDGRRRLSVRVPTASVVGDGWSFAPPALAALLADLRPGRLPPALVRGGRTWWLAELAEEAQLRAWRPDHAAIAELADNTDSLGLCLFVRCHGQAYDLAVRAFPCGIGIDEDPASGAANSLIAAYLAQAEPDGPLLSGYTANQGREIGRDASLYLGIATDGTITVGGGVQTVVRGQVSWPTTGADSDPARQSA